MAHLRANIHGVPVSALTMGQALNEINEWIAKSQRTYVCALAVHGLTEAQSAPDMREIYHSAGMVVPDG